MKMYVKVTLALSLCCHAFMPFRYYAKPLLKIQKVQNLSVAFKFITEVEKIPLINISKCDLL